MGGASSAVPAVGDIEINISGVNPAEKYAGTTWERFAKGKTLIGVDEGDADFSATKREGGEKAHTLTVTEMPSHMHTVDGYAEVNGVHEHGVTGGTTTYGEHVHSYGYYTDRAATGSARNTPGPAGSADAVYSVGGAGDHMHSIAGNTDSRGEHKHNVTGTARPAGGTGSHNNLPPYITVYFWLRTA